jgi:predicted amidohydrolase
MSSPLVAAVIQMNSTAEVSRNLDRAAALCARARERGARLAVLPENFALLSTSEADKFSCAEPPIRSRGERGGGQADRPDGAILRQMRAAARENGLYLVLGGMPEQSPEAGHVYNSCVVLGPDGDVETVYRKIHLFDVDLARAGDATAYRESSTVTPGDAGQQGVAATPWGGLGLSVCYDVRFPELYRRLGEAGARMLVVPAAFTLHTGKDHWHVLLRARAIENQCFVLAAAQQGRHGPTRQTYGHSLIADPWGTVLCECPDGEGVAVAELDFAAQDRVRSELPCLQHRRIAR